MINLETLRAFEQYIKIFSEEISEDDPSNIRVYQAYQDLQSGEKLGDGTNFAFIYGDENLPNLYTYVDTKASTIEIDEKDNVDRQSPPGNFWKYKEQGIELINGGNHNPPEMFSFTANDDIKNSILGHSFGTNYYETSGQIYPYVMERFGVYVINDPIASKEIQEATTGQQIRGTMINNFLPTDPPYRPIEVGESYQAHLDFSNAFKNMERYRIYYRDYVQGTFSVSDNFFDDYSSEGEGTTIEHFDLLRPYHDNIQGVCLSDDGTGGPGDDSGYFSSGYDILIDVDEGLYSSISDYPFKTTYKSISDIPDGGDETAWQNMIQSVWGPNIEGQDQNDDSSHHDEISISDWNANLKNVDDVDNKLVLLFVIMPEWLVGNQYWDGTRPDDSFWYDLYSGPVGVVPGNNYPCDGDWNPGSDQGTSYVGPWPLKKDGQTPYTEGFQPQDCYDLGTYEEELTLCGRGPSWPVFYKVEIDQRFFQLFYANDKVIDHVDFLLSDLNSITDDMLLKIIFRESNGNQVGEIFDFAGLGQDDISPVKVDVIIDDQAGNSNSWFLDLYYDWYFKLKTLNFRINGVNSDDETFPEGLNYQEDVNWPNWIQNFGSLENTYDITEDEGYVEASGYGAGFEGLEYKKFSYTNPIDYITLPNVLTYFNTFNFDDFYKDKFLYENFENFTPIAHIYSALDTDEDDSDEYYPLQLYIDSTDEYPATAPLITDLSFDIAKSYALGTCVGVIEDNNNYDSCEAINDADISSDISVAEECKNYQYCEWEEGGNITYLDENMWSNKLSESGGIDFANLTFPYDITDYEENVVNWISYNTGVTESAWNYDNVFKIPIGYKFAVLQWGDEPSVSIKDDFILLNVLDQIRRGAINPENLMKKNKYIWQEMTYPPLGTGAGLHKGTIQHKYKYPGFYEIKALVFSYVPHPNSADYLITPVRWKLVSIMTNISYNYQTVEDFTSVGGGDFSTVPWPYPGDTGIISGIDMNEDNKYKNSLESIINENKFSTGEFYERSKVYRAYENDEMGDYLGKSDIAQMRMFFGSYDMNDLLMIDPGPLNAGPLWQERVEYCNGEGGINCGTSPCNGPWDHDQSMCENIDPVWHPYDNDSPGWLGNSCVWADDCESGQGYGVDTFPDSCVGIPYIFDNSRPELIENCIFEFNFGDIDGDVIYDNSIDDNVVFDTTGRGNKGILIGDYAIQKNDESPVVRSSAIKFPEIGDEDNAF